MAKGLRSNNKKALRTVRRQKVAENPEWLATAETQRQEVLSRLINSDKPAVRDQTHVAGMDLDSRESQAAEAAAATDAAARTQQQTKKGDQKTKVVTSPGKIHLTKKKAMKLRKKQAIGNDLWQQTAPMAWHSRKSKRKGAH